MSYKRINKTKKPTAKKKANVKKVYTPQIKIYRNMWNPPTLKQLEKIPPLYATEQTPMKDKKVYMKFFIGGWTWYITEINHDNYDIAFGYTVSPHAKEWGYVSLKELDAVKKSFLRVDRDLQVSPYSPQKINVLLKRDGQDLIKD